MLHSTFLCYKFSIVNHIPLFPVSCQFPWPWNKCTARSDIWIFPYLWLTHITCSASRGKKAEVRRDVGENFLWKRDAWFSLRSLRISWKYILMWDIRCLHVYSTMFIKWKNRIMPTWIQEDSIFNKLSVYRSMLQSIWSVLYGRNWLYIIIHLFSFFSYI